MCQLVEHSLLRHAGAFLHRHANPQTASKGSLHVLDVCVQQLQEQLDAADAAVNLCPPRLELDLVEVQQRVVERWEELRDYTERRGEELKLAYQRYLFINTVKTPPFSFLAPWIFYFISLLLSLISIIFRLLHYIVVV